MSQTGKAIETGSRLVVARAGGRGYWEGLGGNRKWKQMCTEFLFLGDRNVLMF